MESVDILATGIDVAAVMWTIPPIIHPDNRELLKQCSGGRVLPVLQLEHHDSLYIIITNNNQSSRTFSPRWHRYPTLCFHSTREVPLRVLIPGIVSSGDNLTTASGRVQNPKLPVLLKWSRTVPSRNDGYDVYAWLCSGAQGCPCRDITRRMPDRYPGRVIRGNHALVALRRAHMSSVARLVLDGWH